MHKLLALVRAHWLTQTSYRLRTVLGIASILVSVIPLYFISGALQPLMAEAIQNEGSQYFGFVVVGMTATLLINAAVQSLPASVSMGISRGTLEVMLSTPTHLSLLLSGTIGAGVLWTFARIAVLVGGGWVLGMPVHFSALLSSFLILLLTLFAYLPVGVIAAALVLMFRTAGPVPQGATYLSILLGGVYYPTHVIPAWLEQISDWIPLTYALRALRRVLLDGASLASVTSDLAILLAFVVGLFILSGLIFAFAYRYSKKAGTLAQY